MEQIAFIVSFFGLLGIAFKLGVLSEKINKITVKNAKGKVFTLYDKNTNIES